MRNNFSPQLGCFKDVGGDIKIKEIFGMTLVKINPGYIISLFN